MNFRTIFIVLACAVLAACGTSQGPIERTCVDSLGDEFQIEAQSDPANADSIRAIYEARYGCSMERVQL